MICISISLSLYIYIYMYIHIYIYIYIHVYTLQSLLLIPEEREQLALIRQPRAGPRGRLLDLQSNFGCT